MKTSVVLALALCASGAVAVPAPRQRIAHGKVVSANFNLEEEWATFKNLFRKEGYRSAEVESAKKAVFAESMARAVERNAANVAAGGAEIFGITKYSDMTQDEFDRANKGRKDHGHLNKEALGKVAKPAADDTADAIDWTALGYVTPVKNQGQCGSCWAHSAVEQIESTWMLAGNAMWELSVQQVNSCTAGTFGCGGGDTTAAYEQLMSGETKTDMATSGVSSEAMTPYVQSMYEECLGPICTQSCSDSIRGLGNLTEMVPYESLTGYYVGISDYSYATSPCTGPCANQDLDTLNANLASTGPASICVNAETWNDYVGGVMKTAACGGYAYSDLDHCVQLTGFNMTADEPYYLVRNSWATTWGEDGYILLSAEGNTCGLADEATFVTLA